MSKVVIVPFENKHAEQILEIGLNSKLLELKPEHKKYAYYLKEVGMSFTGLVNNKPIAAGGVFTLWDGVAEGGSWLQKIFISIQFFAQSI